MLSDGARKEDICTLQYFTKIPHLKASKRRSRDQRGLLPHMFPSRDIKSCLVRSANRVRTGDFSGDWSDTLRLK